MIVGRFAPSPSGRMHLGNLFSALLAWCAVRSADGKMILRLEDLDPDRCRPAFCEQVKADLLWLGLDWDEEMPRQSQRTQAYAQVFDRLQQQGLVYPCYCSRGELHAASAPHLADGTWIYPGTCRALTPAQREAKTRRPAWRLMVPDRVYGVQDGLQGRYEAPVDDSMLRDIGPRHVDGGSETAEVRSRLHPSRSAPSVAGLQHFAQVGREDIPLDKGVAVIGDVHGAVGRQAVGKQCQEVVETTLFAVGEILEECDPFGLIDRIILLCRCLLGMMFLLGRLGLRRVHHLAHHIYLPCFQAEETDRRHQLQEQ